MHRSIPRSPVDGRRARGFTLVELVIGIMLMAIISGIVAVVLNSSFRIVGNIQDRKSIVLDGSSAIRKFSREFALLEKPNSLHEADSKSIKFKTSQGNTVEYELTGSALYRKVSGQGQKKILANSVDVSSSLFSYYEKNNNQLTNLPLSGSDRQKVWTVELVLNMVNGDNTVHFLANVFPENLKLSGD